MDSPALYHVHVEERNALYYVTVRCETCDEMRRLIVAPLDWEAALIEAAAALQWQIAHSVYHEELARRERARGPRCASH